MRHYEGGYDWLEGMSVRAVAAYQDGKLPLSKITASALKSAGWKGTKKEAIELIKSGEWKPCEWHHTSKYFNITYFYDLDDLIDIQEEVSS